MLPFRELECPVLEQIQQEALTYINNHDLLFNGFWNKINSKQFLKENHTVFKYCFKKGYIIDQVALLVVDHSLTPPSIHIDEAPLVAKFNFPIQNTKGTLTRWYDVSQETLDNLPKTLSPFGAEVYDFKNAGEFPIIAETDMSVPVVFNSSIPHAVIPTKDSVYPRIVLACMSNNQPIDLLKD